MADKGLIELVATVLPDAIAKELTNLTYSYTPANASEKWVYKLANVTGSSAKLLESQFASNAIGIDAGSRNAETADADICRFIFIQNTGTTNGNVSTSDSIYVIFDGGTAAHDVVDGVEIPSGMSWYARLPNTTLGNIMATTGTANGAADSSAAVQCVIAAIIDDV